MLSQTHLARFSNVILADRLCRVRLFGMKLEESLKSER